jgi:hypothetical protein
VKLRGPNSVVACFVHIWVVIADWLHSAWGLFMTVDMYVSMYGCMYLAGAVMHRTVVNNAESRRSEVRGQR